MRKRILVGLGSIAVLAVTSGIVFHVRRGIKQAEAIQQLIGGNKKFNVCRVYELNFVKRRGCPGGYCNWSETSEARPIALLAKMKYVRAVEAPIHLVDDSPDVPTWWWTPSADIKSTLGANLTEEQTDSFSLGREQLGITYLDRLGLTGAYKWTLNLGCRSFNQTDAVTPWPMA